MNLFKIKYISPDQAIDVLKSPAIRIGIAIGGKGLRESAAEYKFVNKCAAFF